MRDVRPDPCQVQGGALTMDAARASIVGVQAGSSGGRGCERKCMAMPAKGVTARKRCAARHAAELHSTLQEEC